MSEPDEDTERPAGPILTELGVTMMLNDTDRVTEAMILAKVTNLETGAVSLCTSSNDLDWIAQRGLVAAALHMLHHEPTGTP